MVKVRAGGKKSDEKEEKEKQKEDDQGWKCTQEGFAGERQGAYIAYHEARLHGQVHLRAPTRSLRKRHGHYTL